MQRAFKKLSQLGILTLIVLGMISCNGNDTSAKNTSDSVTAATVADSTAKAAKPMKKKGKTSVAMPGAYTGKMVKDAHGIYNRVDVAPEFPGGQTGLSDYINKNLNYPETAISDGTSGTVHISFVVDEQGKVVNPQVLDSANLGDGLSQEALNVFNKMPSWKPGMVHGKKVKTRLELPVTFQLEDASQ